jgi:predicted dehydrogenase
VAFDAAGNSGNSDVVAVTVDNTISDTTPPEVSIVSPVGGEFVAGTISVSVSASDDIGVTAVELYLDGGFLSVDNTAPFSFTWDTTRTADGTHTLQARAYDAAGNVASSAEINVIVQTAVSDTTAPQVAITFPADGSTVSKLVKIQVQASDDRQMQQVQLFVDGSLFRSATCEAESCSLRFNWNTRKVAKGWHTLSAIAHDAAGNMGTSSAVNVDVK